jgi:PleD family two-component response regulator
MVGLLETHPGDLAADLSPGPDHNMG